MIEVNPYLEQASGKLRMLPILSEEEARFWRDMVWRQKRHWTPRLVTSDHGDTPLYYTLGRAVYLDLAQTQEPEIDYFQLSKKSNILLLLAFGDLLERVRISLENYLKEPVALTNNVALPGFHIFFSKGIEKASTSEPHFDMQHLRINWRRKWDSGKSISFTLPLSLPPSGGGLDVWFEKTSNFSEQERDREHCQWTIRYDLGVMCVQHGLLRHRIAKTPYISDSDERITLQGHGLRFSGVWELYW